MKALSRLFQFLAFRILPLALVLLAVYFGIQAIQSASGYFGARAQYESRQDAYRETATAIAPGDSESSSLQVTPPVVLVQRNDWEFVRADNDLSQLFVTNTPRPEVQLEVTTTPAAPQPEPTEPPPTITLPDVTPGPLPTILYLPEPGDVVEESTAVPTAFPIISRNYDGGRYDLVNILLLGQDNELTGDALANTDTMIIVSINRTTNTVSMLSLPRDLYIYMPQVGMNRLNVTFAVGNALGWDGGPFFFMRQVILYNLGINVHYYAMVDLSGFAELIDMVGGIEIAVDCPIQDYQIIGTDIPAAAIQLNEDLEYLLPVGYYAMNGKQALWYARSRRNSDDFDRGRRQQQILRAGLRKALNSGMLSDPLQWPELVGQGLEIVDTNLQVQDILGLLPVALQIDPSEIDSFRFVRTDHTIPWQPQAGRNAGQFVQLPNPDRVFDLMTDFYTPPSPNQLSLRGASIRVLNGSPNESWDRVAASRLAWDNFAAFAVGEADSRDYPSTLVIDYTGEEKDSVRPEILEALNVTEAAVQIQPDPNREVDFEVIVGSDYNSCSGFVLPPGALESAEEG